MNKSVLVVYSCYNPPTSLLDSIQSIYDKIDGWVYTPKIICVDNNSDLLTTYDIIKNNLDEIKKHIKERI